MNEIINDIEIRDGFRKGRRDFVLPELLDLAFYLIASLCWWDCTSVVGLIVSDGIVVSEHFIFIFLLFRCLRLAEVPSTICLDD